MNKGSPPPAPDYQALAQQQGQQSLDLSKQANPNVISPYGTQTYYDKGSDPATYKQTLENQISDIQKQMPVWSNWDWRYANNLASGDNASERAATWFTNTTNSLNSKLTAAQRALDAFNTSGTVPSDSAHPTVIQKFSPEQQALYDQQTKNQGLLGGLATQGINSAQGVIGKPLDYSSAPAMPGNYNDLRNTIYNANMARANQDIAVNRDNMNSNLVAAGFRPGEQGYDNAMRNIDRQQVDAGQQAQLNAGNQAQQAYGMDLQSRQQGLSELLAQRQVPLNEITALMSGSQTQNPFAMPGYNPVNPQGAPLMQAAQAGSQYGTDLYNLGQAQTGQLTQGLFGLTSAGLGGYLAGQ